MVSRDDIVQLLSKRGVLPTPQRVDVALVILSKPQHLSAEQVIAGIRASGSRVSKATVYNTLNLFCERGLLRTLEVDPTRQFYDSTIEAHHHFYNVDTGELVDIPIGAVTLNVHTALPPGTTQAGVDVVIRVRGNHRG
ncbi:MAG TPA: Fur family transcriptional regulator [Gammaproteobacteria bacterium]|nr:Fur family transcriptional regulator [Gammaproteobacteria bacterium]